MTGTQACKVCNSSHAFEYENEYYKKKGQISFSALEKLAASKGEKISRKAMKNHFEKHYKPDKIQELLDRGTIETTVAEKRQEAINILDEVKENLMGLKALVAKAKNPTDAVAIYKESRMTLQEIERLRTKLSASTSLTKAELYKEIYWACSQLCPKCRKEFWVKLDERLRSKGFA